MAREKTILVRESLCKLFPAGAHGGIDARPGDVLDLAHWGTRSRPSLSRMAVSLYRY